MFQLKLNEISTILPHLKSLRNEAFLNILPIFSYTLIDCKLHIITEYQEAGSLAKRIQNQIELSSKAQPDYFEEDLILRWTRDISNGLIYLHNRNIVHGNLKCENVLFDRHDFIKLSDCGVPPANLATAADQTPANPHFYEYAPEHRTFNSVTVKSDIYMLGTCLYRCVTLRQITKDINPELMLGKKCISSANLILNAKMSHFHAKRTKSAVNLKLKLFGHEYSDLLKRNILSKSRFCFH